MVPTKKMKKVRTFLVDKMFSLSSEDGSIFVLTDSVSRFLILSPTITGEDSALLEASFDVHRCCSLIPISTCPSAERSAKVAGGAHNHRKKCDRYDDSDNSDS